MNITFLEGRIKLEDYQPSFLKDKAGKVLAVTFPIDSFLELTEDIEDYAFADGHEDSEKASTPYAEIVKKIDLTPERIKEIRK